MERLSREIFHNLEAVGNFYIMNISNFNKGLVAKNISQLRLKMRHQKRSKTETVIIVTVFFGAERSKQCSWKFKFFRTFFSCPHSSLAFEFCLKTYYCICFDCDQYLWKTCFSVFLCIFAWLEQRQNRYAFDNQNKTVNKVLLNGEISKPDLKLVNENLHIALKRCVQSRKVIGVYQN